MIAVIGATGFTGHRVVRALRESRSEEEELVAVVRSTSDRTRLDGTRVSFRVADLKDTDALRAALHGAQEVVCAASLAFGHARSICAAVAAEDREHAVFFSTSSIYTSVPTESKSVRVDAENLIRSSSVPGTILRPTMIYGRPGDRNIERLLGWLTRLPVVPLVDGGRALQQPVHVDDLATAVCGVLNSSATIGMSYDLPGPAPLTFREVVRQAARAVHRHAITPWVPLRLARASVAIWSLTGAWPHVSEEQMRRLAEDKSLDLTPAARAFGYQPRSFTAGVTAEAELLQSARRYR